MLLSSLQQPYRYINNRAPSLTGTASHECKHYSQTLSGAPAAGPKHCRHAIVMTNGRLGPRRRQRTPAQLHLFVCASYSIGRLTARAICHTYAYVSAAHTACRVPPARQVPLSVKLHEAVQPSIDDLTFVHIHEIPKVMIRSLDFRRTSRIFSYDAPGPFGTRPLTSQEMHFDLAT